MQKLLFTLVDFIPYKYITTEGHLKQHCPRSNNIESDYRVFLPGRTWELMEESVIDEHMGKRKGSAGVQLLGCITRPLPMFKE